MMYGTSYSKTSIFTQFGPETCFIAWILSYNNFYNNLVWSFLQSLNLLVKVLKTLLWEFCNYFGKANLENSFSCKSKGTSSNSTHCNQLSSKMSWYQLWCINYYKFGLLVSQKLFVYLANKLFHNFHKNHFIKLLLFFIIVTWVTPEKYCVCTRNLSVI